MSNKYTYLLVFITLASLFLTPNNELFEVIYAVLHDVYFKIFSVIFLFGFCYGTIYHHIDQYNWKKYHSTKPKSMAHDDFASDHS